MNLLLCTLLSVLDSELLFPSFSPSLFPTFPPPLLLILPSGIIYMAGKRTADFFFFFLK